MRLILPPDYQLPENARPGEPFEVVAMLQPAEDGSYTLTAIDGIQLPSEEEETEEETEAPEMEEMSDEAKFAKKIPLPWGGENY
jgi:hypothetical protein